MITLGEKLRQLREERDMSLRELSKAVGVSAAFLSDVEFGRRYPSDKHLDMLAIALDTTLEDLKAHDTRPPMRDLRRMTQSNPQYGYAFRQIVDRNISPEELLEFIDQRRKQKDDQDSEDTEEK